LYLGAGFGGLELSTMQSEAFGDGIDVTLIDKADTFTFAYSKLDVMFGHNWHLHCVSRLQEMAGRWHRARMTALSGSGILPECSPNYP